MDNETKNKELVCHQCGNEFVIQSNGTSTHIDTRNLDSINYDLDQDHIAYEL